MSNISKLDAVPAVDDLTDEAAATVEGGGDFVYPIHFDTSQSSRSFYASPGGSVTLYPTTSSSPSNKFYTAVLRNLKTGKTSRQTATVGWPGGSVVWKGVRGGFYSIDLVDSRDGIFVSGRAIVFHTTT